VVKEDQDTAIKNMILTTELIQNLEQETKSILALCNTLNKDEAFIQKINILADSNQNSLLRKAEHFLLSDLIIAYSKSDKESEKSKFVLAYYYDALRNQHFADKRQIASLNKLILTDEFKSQLSKIKKDNIIPAINSQNKYFVLSVLAEIKDNRLADVFHKFQQFLYSSLDLKFTSTKELTDFMGFVTTAQPNVNKRISDVPEDDSLEKVIEELNQLIGLENIKKDIRELINLLEIQKKRSDQGLKNIDITLHTVFLGPPGTGKTSVARLLSRVFKHLGFLSKGQLCETDREGMIAGYVGQTATKVDQLIAESIGGVLFIDEAYALTQNAFGNDYGAEAVNTLLKRMEDEREDLAVIVAGYTEPMKMFIESNPGLRSRFNRFFHFRHFTTSELLLIFEGFCKKSDFIITEDAKEKLADTFELLYSKKDEGFGNARVVRNIFEKCAQNHANRVIKLTEINPQVLSEFTEEDIPEPKETLEQVYFMSNNG
jgi:AAA+ superfamily predicted ATPase